MSKGSISKKKKSDALKRRKENEEEEEDPIIKRQTSLERHFTIDDVINMLKRHFYLGLHSCVRNESEQWRT
jgi:hypothetical protein